MSLLYDQNLSTDIMKMPEAILHTSNNQSTTTIIEDSDLPIDEQHQSTDSLSNPINQKQKSLVSIYDNHLQQQSISNGHPLVGIIGRNKRSEAFRKRLLLSGFPSPILCDINSSVEIIPDANKSTYISYEFFYELSPTIILITENLTTNFEDLFPQTKHQLVIDTREISPKYFSNKTHISSSIPGSYRAFGNLSNREIEHGTQRTRVTLQQYSPSNLIKFIHDLNCFPCGLDFLDHYTYNYQQSKLSRNCLFPLISTVIIFTLCLIISIIEHSTELIYRQASSITAATSMTLLALFYLIKPIFDIIELTYLLIFKSQNTLPNTRFLQHCFHSQNYLIWYSLSFALLHIIFLIFSKLDLTSNLSICAFFLGIFTLILLCILSYAHFPWISERLLWTEYQFFTTYLGLFCLLLTTIHAIVLHWKSNANSFSLKTFSLILPLIVLILRFIIHGMIYPIQKLIQWTEQRQVQTSIMPSRDASMFL